LIFSGALFGAALMMKFSAGLLVPASLCEMFLTIRDSGTRRRCFTRFLAVWFAGVIGTIGLFAGTIGLGGLSLLLTPHVLVQEVPGLSRPGDFPFPTVLFAIHADGYLCCAAGLWVVRSRKLWRTAAFPMLQLATAALVHSWHRPWWDYYYLHLAIPIAWLGSVFVRDAAQSVWDALRGRARIRTATFGEGILLAALVVQSVHRFAGTAHFITSGPRISSDPMLAQMIHFQARTHWVYAQPIIYPFHARLRLPPELAVVTLKRYWSGQITSKQILATVRQYQPEQVLLFKSPVGPEWSEFLKTNYRIEFDDGKKVLYVTRSWPEDPPER
jgi:hypothetical protein